MKIGYPCINLSLDCKGDRTFRLKSYSDERLVETVANNLNCLVQMLHFNVAHNYVPDGVRSLVAYNCAAAFAQQDNEEMMLPYIEEFCRLRPSSVVAGRIFENGKPVPVDIDLAKRAKEDEAFKDY